MTLFIGQKIERAWWFRNELERFVGEKKARTAVVRDAAAEGATVGPVTVETLKAGSPRISDPPEQWRDAPCLVAWARVVAVSEPLVRESFIAGPDRRDLDRLRQVTRAMHHKARPGDPPLSDAEVDAMIEGIGPKVGARMLKDAVDRRIVH